MDARIVRALLLSAAVTSFAGGAGYRTENFILNAPTPRLAREIGDHAERCRRELAVDWLSHELPRWPAPCLITATVAPHLGAGGATSFMFDQGRPFGWRMSIQGSRQRILDSVLPHEVTHTIFATHFGRPLPRWADEGACTTVEHDSEKNKQKKMLVQFLTTGRGIAFNRMFAMKEYPPDILPLYSQGYSLARYLIGLAGRRQFVQYVGDGMRTNNWAAATKKYYGIQDLSRLQLSWLDWVRQGSPPVRRLDEPTSDRNQIAQSTPPDGQNGSVTGSFSEASWYIQHRDRVRASRQRSAVTRVGERDSVNHPHLDRVRRSSTRLQSPQGVEPIILEWNQPVRHPEIAPLEQERMVPVPRRPGGAILFDAPIDGGRTVLR